MRRTSFLPQALLAIALSFGLAQAAYDVDGSPVLKMGSVVPIDRPDTWYSTIDACPAPCMDQEPQQWTVYSSASRLSQCKQPMLFDLAIHSSMNPMVSGAKVRACTASTHQTLSSRPHNENHTPCLATAEGPKNIPVRFGRNAGSGSSTSSHASDVVAVLDQIQGYMTTAPGCDDPIMFAYSNNTIAGVYVGASFGRETVASLTARLREEAVEAGSITAQLCGRGRNARHVLGIAVDTTGNVAAVRAAVRSWSRAECLRDSDSQAWREEEVKVWESIPHPSNRTRTLRRRDDDDKECETTRVEAGDDCGVLAERCGISASDFDKYNPDDDLCSSLKPGQPVCCSSGELPDIRPKPEEDGTCATHLVKKDEDCSVLGPANGLTNKEIEEFNNGTTWGWNGCGDLNYGINICLSKGDPPMPAPVSNAQCGPTKPGTKKPDDDTKLEDLNPCPLNVCCNIWGQCGISEDYCLEERGPADNPGTSPEGKNGCVASCGLNITNNDDKPASQKRIGYYESWNFDRPCLNQRVRSVDSNTYTHLHWAFASINTDDWTVKINDTYKQWDDFKSLGLERIISFGGWGFSTEPETYDVLRQAMSKENRETFAENVASFLDDEWLDGVDFDWEYPGAMDIPGTPPGNEDDGANYLEFLKVMREKLPEGKTLSIAAPASYWYLKAFPIKKMAEELDYIVYMTYDLHGQWDAENEYANPGCPEGGRCLRSHVNVTETRYALSMITKAGVEGGKIVVGESSYGRSFKMSKEGCTGPECLFEGGWLDSKAKKGLCTDTAGYISNAEIDDIIQNNADVEQWYDSDSGSDILVYDGTEWVAYLGEGLKQTRRWHWESYNMAGTVDWAVDLQNYTNDDYMGPSGDDDLIGEQGDAPKPPDCQDSYDNLDDLDKDKDKIDSECAPQYMLEVLKAILDDALDRYDKMIEDDYDDNFNKYAEAVAKSGDSQVEKFMYEHGDDYFSCTVTETIECCESCHATWDDDSANCRYCEDYDCNYDPSCDQPANEGLCEGIEFRYKNMSQPCPPDYSERGQEEPQPPYRWSQSVYWEMDDDKEDKFYVDLYENTGIDEEFIVWDDVHHWECAPTDDHCADRDWDYNFPVTEGYSKEDVLNPKDLVSEARKNLTTLAPDIGDVLDQMKDRKYYGDADELVDAVSIPILMVQQAVDNMEEVVDAAEEIEEQERKAIILAFLSAILLVVPFVGEVVGAVASMATIGRIIALAGAAGNAAMDIYTIVDDPENAPLAIFSLVLGGIGDLASIAQAAKIRRGMSSEDLGKLGLTGKGSSRGPLNKIDDIRQTNICKIK
ncbi:uncharacterized protein BJX67DRAFT_292234 [Aspergillus lucknowensis]|uniref:chitinase n=1 Tax=Aspergillus lucknowensis TaxID=176173 RepID=A0ABR4LDS3_9EURO